MKQHKVFDLCDNGIALICIKRDQGDNPYRVYRRWWEQGMHREQLHACADMASALWFAYAYYSKNA